MKILIIDTSSNALDWAIRCQRWGHEVLWYDKRRSDGEHARAGEGIITKIRDFEALRKKWIGWADLIYLPDNAHYVDMLEPYRKLGYPIFGCNAEGAKLELDRTAGQRACAEAGMSIIPSRSFHDYDSAIAYVKKVNLPMVSKPSGEADKALSYVADSAKDLWYMLERWKKVDKYRAAARQDGFILQDKVAGCEMAVGGWFGPGGWAPLFCENWEYKKLMDGDLGVNTGEQGTLVRLVRRSKLAAAVLLPLTPLLEEIGYVGYIDNNTIIDEKGVPWPLELTMRDGWPLRHNLMALQRGDPAKWMLDLLEGRSTMEAIADKACVSVVVSIPDYPYSRLTSKEIVGIPVYNATDLEHVHLSEVMLGEAPIEAGGKLVMGPSLLTAGDYVLICTGVGDTITGARKSAYAAVRKIKIPNSPSYRLDIGKGRLLKQLPKIQKLGYAKGLTF